MIATKLLCVLSPSEASPMGGNIPADLLTSSTLLDVDVKYNELCVNHKHESSSCSGDSSSSDGTSSSDFDSEDADIVEEFNRLDFGDLLLSSAQRVNLRKLFKPGEFESLCRFDQKRITRIENKLTLALRLNLPLPHEDIIREKIGLRRQISHPTETSDTDSDEETSCNPTLLRGLSGDETAARMSFISKYCEERESGQRIVSQKIKRKKVLKPPGNHRIIVEEKPKFEAFKEVSTSREDYRTRTARIVKYAEPDLPEDDHFVCYGVWADVAVPKNTVFGPYKGCIVGRYDVKHLVKVCSGGYSWEVGSDFIYSTVGTASVSLHAPSGLQERYQEEQNLVAFQYRGEIYYRSFCDIKPNTELFVWYGSQFASQLGIQGSLKQRFCRPPTCNESHMSEEVSRNQNGYGTEILDIPKSDHARVKDNNSCSPSRQSREKSFFDFATQGRLAVVKDEELTAHSVLQRPLADQKRFKCDTCGTRFRRKDTLRFHKRTHTGERPFRCEVCGARFNRKGGLTSHKLTHTGEKPYKCQICGARFRRKSILESHKVTHTGIQPFKCDICGSRFTRKDTLQKHQRIHTGEKPFNCEMCGVRYSDVRNLRRHERTHTAIAIVREIQGQLIMEKGLATFTAEVASDGITGYWTKHGVVLQSSEKYQIRSEHRVRQLTIGNICEDDSGEYSFHVGRSKTTGRITVQAVTIKSQLEPVTIKETQTAVLQCIVSHPHIASNINCWSKNGSRIQNIDRISTNVEGQAHTLSIRDCTAEDSGQYAFQVGNYKSEAKLEVQDLDNKISLGQGSSTCGSRVACSSC